MKIRHYKIEDRQGLGKLDSLDWEKHFKKYLEDIECPFVDSSKLNQLEWLLQYAIKLEYSDNGESSSVLICFEIIYSYFTFLCDYCVQ